MLLIVIMLKHQDNMRSMHVTFTIIKSIEISAKDINKHTHNEHTPTHTHTLRRNSIAMGLHFLFLKSAKCIIIIIKKVRPKHDLMSVVFHQTYVPVIAVQILSGLCAYPTLLIFNTCIQCQYIVFFEHMLNLHMQIKILQFQRMSSMIIIE